MDQQTALEIAQAVWGKTAFAAVDKEFRIGDKPTATSDGYVVASGPICGYRVGYTRKGKFGGALYTQKGRGTPAEGFAGAFRAAVVVEMRRKPENKLPKLLKVLAQHGITAE